MADSSLDELLKPYSPEVQALVRLTRDLVLQQFPGAAERINPGWKVISFGAGPKVAQQVCVISPQRSRVDLGFARGTTLSDPDGLLEGTGKGIRLVKIKDEERLRSGALRDLIRAAVAAAGD